MTIKLSVALQLIDELSGVPSRDLKGIVYEKMPFNVKYDLFKSIKELEKEREVFKDTLSELLKKYGKKDKDGNYKIDTDSKDFKSFDKEYLSLLDKDISIEIKKIKIEDVMFETESFYPAFFEHLVDSNE